MTDSDYESEQLTREVLKNGLSNLGKTFNNARHAFLTLNLSQKNLSHVKVSYKNISSFNLTCKFLTFSCEGHSKVHTFISNRLIKQPANEPCSTLVNKAFSETECYKQ